jgi:hypothetical protein
MARGRTARFALRAAAGIAIGAIWCGAVPAAAQNPVPVAQAGAQPPASGRAATPPSSAADSIESERVILAGDDNAVTTRDRLRRLLTRQYPDTLAEVLRRDPSLLRNESYLAPYPALAAFLRQHPEVSLNPTYYLGSPREQVPSDPETLKISAMRSVFEQLTVMTAFLGFLALVAWVTKIVADQRRWSKAMKAQHDAHGKVIDRLTSNEDLLAYVQTPAGQRYLMASAPPPAGDTLSPAPYARILTSVQIGSVAALVGIGLLLVSNRWSHYDDWSIAFARVLFLLGAVLVTAGAGFSLSAGVSYVLSRRFGLITDPPAPHA